MKKKAIVNVCACLSVFVTACSAIIEADRSKVKDDLFQPTPVAGSGGTTEAGGTGGTGGVIAGGEAPGGAGTAGGAPGTAGADTGGTGEGGSGLSGGSSEGGVPSGADGEGGTAGT